MKTYSAIITKDEGMYVAKCPEVGTVSQGSSIEEALANLKEATELYLEEFGAKDTFRPIMTTFEVRDNVPSTA
ncbi:MAG: type II toxin-antitoxin system HicB family antitoxin [Candidatus Micrarchaeota archaeon]